MRPSIHEDLPRTVSDQGTGRRVEDYLPRSNRPDSLVRLAEIGEVVILIGGALAACSFVLGLVWIVVTGGFHGRI